MRKNSILQLVGQKNNIFLSHDQAKQVEKYFSDENYPSDFVIRLNNPPLSFRKSAIRTVEVNLDTDEANDPRKFNLDNFYEEERQRRIIQVNWTPEQKSGHTDIFQGLYKISTGEEASAEDISKAKEVQKEFFIKNPKRILCDMYLLKPLIPMRQSKISPFAVGFFNLVEKAVFRDMQLSGQFRNNINIPILKEAKENESIEDMKNRAEINREMDKKFTESVQSALDNF